MQPNLELIRDRIGDLVQSYDAVALEGLSSSFKIGSQTYRHDYLWRFLELDAIDDRFADGSGLRASLERHLVRSAAEELKPLISGKTILFFSGLNRYGSAEVLSAYSRHLVFGDLLYGFRLGIPISSFRALVRSAPRLVRVVGQTPVHWFWPAARSSRRVMPRFTHFFRRADVIVGGISYFQRYAPRKLEGKIVFTNLYREEDLELFARLGVRIVVSLTPRIGGVHVPLSVLEAALKLDAGGRPRTDIGDFYLDQLQQLSLRPWIADLAGGQPSVPTREPEPAGLPELVKPAAVPPVRLSADEGVARFCFVIHPLSFEHLARLRIVEVAGRFVSHRLIEDAAAQLAPMPVGVLRNLVSTTGAKAEGLLYAIPMTSKAIMRFPPQHLYRKLVQVAEEAAKLGCRLMGLGAYTSVVGDAGISVAQQAPIAITTGNSYTVHATLETLRAAARACGMRLDECTALVVGATGSIGAACARLLAPRVKELCLVGPRPERLLGLSRKITDECPGIQGRLRLSRRASDYVPRADLIIATTSAVEPVVDVRQLRPGCVVCDVARPPDISQEDAARREDVLVIESGEVKLPEGAELTFNIGLKEGTIYACLAETALLALERRFENFTLGREIEPQKVRLAGELGEKHGFELAELRSFGEAVPANRFARLAAINRDRFTSASR